MVQKELSRLVATNRALARKCIRIRAPPGLQEGNNFDK